MARHTAASSFTLLLCFVSILAAPGDFNNLNNFIFSGDYEFIDLSHPYDNSTVYWPTAKSFRFTNKVEELKPDGSWYAANDFETGEHVGTHIDAPYHFYKPGIYVGEIPLEKLIVPMIIVDVSSQVNDNPNFILYKHHMDYLLNDNFGKPCVLIFKFGWSKFYEDKQKYLGQSSNGLNFPGLSAEVADWIVKSYKNIVGIGVDVASVDPGHSRDFPVHKILQEAGLYNLENVNLSTNLPDYGCTSLALPMKISFGSGAPLRLVAICPKQIKNSF